VSVEQAIRNQTVVQSSSRLEPTSAELVNSAVEPTIRNEATPQSTSSRSRLEATSSESTSLKNRIEATSVEQGNSSMRNQTTISSRSRLEPTTAEVHSSILNHISQSTSRSRVEPTASGTSLGGRTGSRLTTVLSEITHKIAKSREV